MFNETDQDRFNHIIELAKYVFGSQYDLHPLPTATFDRLKDHIYEHKFFLEVNHSVAIDISPSFTSWLEYVYEPLLHSIMRKKLVKKYKRHPLEIYFHVCDHWHYMKEEKAVEAHHDVSTYDAVRSFKKSHKKLD